ncbi:hypothetical protein KJ632_05220 [Patescibacteria group bacterium]|nr:hypothetical protein [Patescibacteria group bacterium]
MEPKNQADVIRREVDCSSPDQTEKREALMLANCMPEKFRKAVFEAVHGVLDEDDNAFTDEDREIFVMGSVA